MGKQTNETTEHVWRRGLKGGKTLQKPHSAETRLIGRVRLRSNPRPSRLQHSAPVTTLLRVLVPDNREAYENGRPTVRIWHDMPTRSSHSQDRRSRDILRPSHSAGFHRNGCLKSKVSSTSSAILPFFFCFMYSFILKMETVYSIETSDSFYRIT
jgi:hypothetical protein